MSWHYYYCWEKTEGWKRVLAFQFHFFFCTVWQRRSVTLQYHCSFHIIWMMLFKVTFLRKKKPMEISYSSETTFKEWMVLQSQVASERTSRQISLRHALSNSTSSETSRTNKVKVPVEMSLMLEFCVEAKAPENAFFMAGAFLNAHCIWLLLLKCLIRIKTILLLYWVSYASMHLSIVSLLPPYRNTAGLNFLQQYQ